MQNPVAGLVQAEPTSNQTKRNTEALRNSRRCKLGQELKVQKTEQTQGIVERET